MLKGLLVLIVGEYEYWTHISALLPRKKKNTMYRAKTLICAVVFEGSKVMLRFFVCIVQDWRETGSSAAYFSESLLSCRVTGIKLTMFNIAHVFLHLIFRKKWISKELYCGLSAAHKTSHFNSLCSLWGLWRLARRVLASLVESGKDFISHSYPS